MEELKELKKELEEILEKVNAKLEEDKTCWTISSSGRIIEDTEKLYRFDKFRGAIGNYFETEQEAEEYLEDLKVKTEIKKIAKELNGDEEIDWDNNDQEKYHLNYSHKSKNIYTEYDYTFHEEGATYCLDKDFHEKCIERIGEERLKKYLTRN